MIRWVCNKCNKRWIYPVKKCLYCNEIIEKQVGKKFTVVGVSKVNIPSPMHPIIPYYVLMLENEHGDRMPKKTLKKYMIGQEFKFENGDVSYVKVKYDMQEALVLALDLINGIEVNENSRVLIKPNVSVAQYPYLAQTTHPNVVAVLINYLLCKGVKAENIIVADSTVLVPLSKTSGKTGIAGVCKKFGVQMKDLSQGEFVDHDGYEISKDVVESDLVINMPIMKTDSRYGLIGALENMTRVCSRRTVSKIFKDFDNNMAKLNRLLPKYLTIADATIGMKGNGPYLGEPAFMNALFASFDPVAIDTVYSKLIMLDVPDYVKNTDGNHEPVVGGDEIEANRLDLMKAVKGFSPNYDIKLIGDSICPYCYDATIGALSSFLNIRGNKTHLAIGSVIKKEDVEGNKKIIAVGDHAIDALYELGIEPVARIPGCPPNMIDMVTYIKKIYMSTSEKPSISVVDKVKASLIKSVKK
ncbi:DUF362 domain-containing protein [Nanoarchaeota archaeon]